LDRRKKVNLLMQYSLSKHPDLPNVPLVTLRGYVRDAELRPMFTPSKPANQRSPQKAVSGRASNWRYSQQNLRPRRSRVLPLPATDGPATPFLHIG
jgi:hypothetical protein